MKGRLLVLAWVVLLGRALSAAALAALAESYETVITKMPTPAEEADDNG